MKRWRKFVIAHLLKQCNQTLTDMEVSRATCGQFDVYEFGVFTGRALKAMSPILARHGVAHALWGFDSVRAPSMWRACVTKFFVCTHYARTRTSVDMDMDVESDNDLMGVRACGIRTWLRPERR